MTSTASVPVTWRSWEKPTRHGLENAVKSESALGLEGVETALLLQPGVALGCAVHLAHRWESRAEAGCAIPTKERRTDTRGNQLGWMEQAKSETGERDLQKAVTKQ